MPHSLEARNHASEIKFVIDAALGPRIRDWARTHLEPDPHGAGPLGDGYDTSSLYFDTAVHDVFHRRGSYGRAKYRIRRYSNADFVFLERKLRRPGLVVKRRTRAPLDLLSRFDLSGPVEPWYGSWFGARLSARRLVPVCQVSYHRMARGANRPEGPIRLTLDDDILALPVTTVAFTAAEGEIILPGRMILELKFRGSLPVIFRRLVEHLVLQPRTASKYRLAMVALGHAASPGAGDRPATSPELRD